MNFDNLRDAWAQEPSPAQHIPVSLTGSTTSAITRLRKNMRDEFFWTMAGLVATLAFLLVWRWQHITILTFCAAFFLFTQAGYFFTRFFLFYRRTADYDLGLRKSLRKFVYELELNMEIYKTYSFCVTPLACLLWFALIGSGSGLVRFDAAMPTSVGNLAWLLGTLVCTQFIVAYCLRFHLRMQYGRYLKELKGVLDDLEK